VLQLLSSFFVLAQSKYDYYWTLGYDESTIEPGGDVILIDFNAIPVAVQTLKTVERFDAGSSTSSMSDAEGNLIFYTNGCYVVNAIHEKMMNGDSINPGIQQQFCCPFGGSCNFGGAIAIPWPDSPHMYLLFINDYIDDVFPNDPVISGAPRHLYYNTIDMQKDAGLGAVTLKNQVAIDDTLATNSVEACRHSNGRDWWVMIPKSRTNCYFLVLVTPEGVGTPKLTCTGIPYNKFEDSGQSCFSPDGKKFVRFNRDNGVHIYDFDNTAGELSNETWFKINDLGSYVVGAAISPNSRYLYISGFDKLLQYDLNAADIEASRLLLAVPDNVPDPFVPSVFALSALAPDGKIYIASVSSHTSLHVIHRPDCHGLYSLPERRGLSLTSWNYSTIPNMPHFRNEPSTYPCDSFVVHTYTPIDGREAVVVFPNPATDQVNIYLNHPLPNASWWVLHDQLGREIKRVPLDPDEMELSVSLEDYPPGILYFSVMSDTRLIQRGKLILLR
jgi:hypothetical protein